MWKRKSLSHLWLFVTPWTIQIHQTLQARILEPFPSPRDLPNPGIKPRSLALQADSLPAEPQGKPRLYKYGSVLLFSMYMLILISHYQDYHCLVVNLQVGLIPLCSLRLFWLFYMVCIFIWFLESVSVFFENSSCDWIYRLYKFCSLWRVDTLTMSLPFIDMV